MEFVEYLVIFEPKGRLPKKKSGKSVVFCQTRGEGGSPRVNKKPNLKFANVFFSVSMQNHSRTAKKCFTLGLECLCLVYSHWDNFENSPRVPNHAKKKASIIKEIYFVLKWNQA